MSQNEGLPKLDSSVPDDISQGKGISSSLYFTGFSYSQ